mgnify:CR=1 FL=1
MVGDRLETHIRMGYEAGMHTAVVLTGATIGSRQNEPNPEQT